MLDTDLRLDGAKCVGHAELFDLVADDPHATDSIAEALALCRTCPARTPCAEWFDSLPKSSRPRGVIAGRLVQPKSQRREIA